MAICEDILDAVDGILDSFRHDEGKGVLLSETMVDRCDGLGERA